MTKNSRHKPAPGWSEALISRDRNAISKLCRRIANSPIHCFGKMSIAYHPRKEFTFSDKWHGLHVNTYHGKRAERFILWNILRREAEQKGSVFADVSINNTASFVLTTNEISSKAIVAKIDSLLPFSITGIESRLGLLQERCGRVEQKEEKQRLEYQAGSDLLAKFIIWYLSIKAEGELNPRDYGSIIDDAFKDGNDPTGSFIKSLLLPWSYLTTSVNGHEQWSSCLLGMSIVDRTCLQRKYLGFLCDQKLILNESLSSLRILFTNGRAERAIYSILQGSMPGTDGIFDKYTVGDYDAARCQSASTIELSPWRIDLLEICIRSCIHLNAAFPKVLCGDNLLGKISQCYRRILTGSGNMLADKQFLENTANRYAMLPFAAMIIEFTYRTFGSFSRKSSDRHHAMICGCLPIDNPFNPWRNIIGDMVKLDNAETQRALRLDEEAPRAPDYRRARIRAGKFLRAENYASAIDALSISFAGNDSIFGVRDAERIRIRAMAKLLSPEMPKYFMNQYIADTSMVYLCDLNDLVDSAAKIKAENADTAQSIASLLFATSQHASFERSQEQIKSHVTKWWLLSRKARPSDIIPEKPSSSCYYFYLNVLRPEIIDCLWLFNSQRDVLEERMKILRNLSKKSGDTAGTKTVADEMQRLAQEVAVNDAIAVVNASKITIDKHALKTRIQNAISGHFSRAKQMPSSAQEGAEEIIRHVQRLLDAREDNPDGTKDPLVVFIAGMPRTERSEQISKLLRVARDEFCWSNELGLNAYVSMNIRHGTLEGQFRSVFSKQDLLVGSSADVNKSLSQTWLDFSQDNADHRNRLHHILAEITKGIGKITRDIKDKCLQICSEDKNPDGGIDMKITNELAKWAHEAIDSPHDLSEFSSECMEKMTHMAQTGLSDAALKLGHEYLPEMMSLIDTAERKAKETLPPASQSAICVRLSHVRTSLQEALSLVKSWLTISDRREMPDFNPQIVVNVVSKMIGTVFPGVPQISFTCQEDMVLSGKYFMPMVSMMYILSENAIKYCGLEFWMMALSVDVSRLGDSVIRISHTNKKVLNKTQSDKLSAAIEMTKSVADLAIAGGEGKSGLMKIVRTAKYDMAMEVEISFVESESETTVNIELRQ